MGAHRVMLATAAVLAVALAGCAGRPAVLPTPTEDATGTPTPAPSAPLTCDDLVPAESVAATLVGADGEPVEPVAATNGSDAFAGVLIEGVGGLACSWRVGAGMPEYGAPSDWAYLRVDVLPDAADAWVPLQFGDAPSTDTREIVGIAASVGGGDSGWAVSAPVGDDWVVASISAAGLAGTGSRFDGIDGDAMIDRLAAVAESAFTALAEAAPEPLGRPSVELRETDAACSGPLDEAGIVAAMQLRVGTTIEYETTDATTDAPRDFGTAVRAAARTFDCALLIDGGPLVTITVAPGFAPLFDRLRQPDGDVMFDELRLGDLPADVDARAVVERSPEGPASVVLLAVGEALHHIRGDRVEEVARAIVAQAG